VTLTVLKVVMTAEPPCLVSEPTGRCGFARPWSNNPCWSGPCDLRHDSHLLLLVQCCGHFLLLCYHLGFQMSFFLQSSKVLEEFYIFFMTTFPNPAGGSRDYDDDEVYSRLAFLPELYQSAQQHYSITTLRPVYIFPCLSLCSFDSLDWCS
jgi:hypothetical protein